MSILSKLKSRWKNYREDVTYAVWPDTFGSLTEKNAPPTFIPSLIISEVWSVTDLSHLRKVSDQDPLGNYITYGIANEALGDWFRFTDEDGNEIMPDVKYEMKVLQAKETMIQALAYERVYGYSYVYTGKNRYVPKTEQGGRLASLHALTPEECKVKTYNDIGEPVTMELTVEVGKGDHEVRKKKIKLPAGDFIFINTRPLPGRGYKGHSALKPVWDDLTYLRFTKHSMGHYDMKIGHGIFTVITKAGIPDKLISKLNTALEDVSVKRSMVIDGNKVEDIKWLGANAGATDFTEHVQTLLQSIAVGTGIPYDYIIGSSGTMAGSDMPQKAGFKKLSEIQQDMEFYLRDIIERMGYSRNDYFFAWNARYPHDEEEKSKIEMNNAQATAIKMGWMTIDEIRQEQGLPPLPDGRGEGLTSEMSQFNMKVEGLEQTRNPEGAQV
jgi:hypothetical protein